MLCRNGEVAQVVRLVGGTLALLTNEAAVNARTGRVMLTVECPQDVVADAEEPKNEPKKKPKPKQPLFPLKKGMRVKLRDGRVATVTSVEGGGGAAYLDSKSPDAIGPDCVFANGAHAGKGNGAGIEKSFDVMGFADEEEAEEMRLELPIQIGQRVELKDGRRGVTVECQGKHPTHFGVKLDDTSKGDCTGCHAYRKSGMTMSGVRKPSSSLGHSDVMYNVNVPEEAPKLTLPLTVGQKVILRDGRKATVTAFDHGRGKTPDMAIAKYKDEKGKEGCVWASIGKTSKKGSYKRNDDAVADDVEEPGASKLTLPLTKGQRVVAKNGMVGTVRDMGKERAVVAFDGGGVSWHHTNSGLYGGREADPDFGRHLVSDA